MDAGNVSVRAVGTAFDVYRHDQRTDVAVTEGVVRLDAAAFEPTKLSAGQRAQVSSESNRRGPTIAVIDPADMARSLAWRDGELDFVEAPLGAAIAEFNRYHRQQLLIDDPQLQSLTFGGRFSIQNIDAFVRLLETSFNIVAERRDAQTIVLRRAAPQ